MKNPEGSRRLKTSILCRSMAAGMICSVLSGCAALTGPERLEIPANTSDFKTRLYTGVSVGNSRLKPDTSGTVFNVDSSSDMGTQLRLGYDVHNMLAVELDTSVLGASQLREAGTDVKYSSAAISALIYGWSGVQLRSRREGLSAYGRFGYGSLKKSSAVLDLEESGAVPILGLGAEYGFSNGLGIRAEITRFDSDASYVGFGAIYRFGISPAGIGRMIAEAAEPALGAAHTTVAADGRVLSGRARGRFDRAPAQTQSASAHSSPNHSSAQAANSGQAVSHYNRTVADRWRPAMRAGDRDSDGVLNAADNCPDTAQYVTVDRYGCGLFDAVLEDVTFKSGSRWLSARARGQLDRVADTLLAFPESRVQVRAHTDSQGAADQNLSLSSRRAEVVVQYLQSRGVDELQMQAVGMGEAQPIDSNANKSGRKRNRRVDIVTLPDQDAGHLLVASSTGSARVIGVSDPSRRTDEDDVIAADAWNSTPRWQAGRTQSSNVVEPGLLAAKPSAKKSEFVASGKPQNRTPVSTILPLPIPGIAPSPGIAGVVKGLSFARGSTTLTEDAKKALKPLRDALNNNPSVRVAVMAHTDDQGEIEDNKVLSTARAESVVSYLSSSGINSNRLVAEGYGELLPLVQNMTDSDRARNRRIEIRVLRAAAD